MNATAALKSLMNIALSCDIGSYQGDWLAVVVEDSQCWGGTRGGFLVNSYGSCSHCDAWLSAVTVEEKLDILTRLVGSIRWFDKPSDLVAWLNSDDRSLNWYAHEPKYRDFVDRVAKAATGCNDWLDFLWNCPRPKETDE